MMTLEEAQHQVDCWIKKYGVRYFSELTNMAVLTEEVGELARVMSRKYGDQSFKEGEKDNIEDEIADVLWVLLCIANQTGVNVTEAFARNLEKKTQRRAGPDRIAGRRARPRADLSVSRRIPVRPRHGMP